MAKTGTTSRDEPAGLLIRAEKEFCVHNCSSPALSSSPGPCTTISAMYNAPLSVSPQHCLATPQMRRSVRRRLRTGVTVASAGILTAGLVALPPKHDSTPTEFQRLKRLTAREGGRPAHRQLRPYRRQPLSPRPPQVSRPDVPLGLWSTSRWSTSHSRWVTGNTLCTIQQAQPCRRQRRNRDGAKVSPHQWSRRRTCGIEVIGAVHRRPTRGRSAMRSGRALGGR